jgi:probable phosphoglycerate mutase
MIRHAEPARVVDAVGPADPPLHSRGRLQVERLAGWLRHEPLDAVLSSPMRRARQTAEPIAAAHGLDVQIDDDLAEFDVRATTYIPYEELKATKDARFVAMSQNRLDAYSVDVCEFQAKVVTAFERIIATHRSRRVAVFCHGGVINAFTAHVAGIPRVLWFETDYTSITRVAASSRAGAPRSIVTLNETSHLRRTALRHS